MKDQNVGTFQAYQRDVEQLLAVFTEAGSKCFPGLNLFPVGNAVADKTRQHGHKIALHRSDHPLDMGLGFRGKGCANTVFNAQA